MDRKASLVAALKAVLYGSLVGAAIPTAITTIVATGMASDGFSDGGVIVLLVVTPFLICLAAGLGGFIFLGIPFTLLLRRLDMETGANYGVGGAAVGAGALMLGSWLIDADMFGALLFSFFGIVTGGAIGYFWWRFGRRPVVEATSAETAEVFL